MKKRLLFVGPTGSGKSTLINVLFNNAVNKESMSAPAIASDTSSGVTSIFTTYYNFPDYAYTDSVGFGDNRYDNGEIFNALKCIIKQSMVGYNRIYLCLRYGRISQEIHCYIEFLTAIFDKDILNYITIVFTHCKDQSMTKAMYLEKNKNDTHICAIINQVSNVIFGDNNVDDDEEIDQRLWNRRRKFWTRMKVDLDTSSTTYYIPHPTDLYDWITRIGYILKKLIAMYNPIGSLASIFSITHDEIQKLTKLFGENDHVKYQEYYGECSICFDSMWSKDSKITKCHHVFHRQCLLQLTRLVCPLCNGRIDLLHERD
jgi:GTPase SAR1 family protein